VDKVRPTLARALAIGCAAASLAAAVLVGDLALASHLPFAPDLNKFRNLAFSTNAVPKTWRAVHVLAAGCRCSRGVAEYLASRGPVSGLQESVLLIGSDPVISRLIALRSLAETTITPGEADERYHLEGAPWLVIIAPDDSIRYAGGYSTDRNPRGGYLDVSIWNAVSAGKSYRPLPAFGCAVSERVQRAIDPLGLKYPLYKGHS
jgi:hypothetical protein